MKGWPFGLTVEQVRQVCEMADEHGRIVIGERLGIGPYAAGRALSKYHDGRLKVIDGGVELDGVQFHCGDGEFGDDPYEEDSFHLQPPCYVFDSATNRYIYYLLCENRPLVVSRDTIDSFLAGYSNDGGKETINTLKRRFGWTRQRVIEILRAHHFTHDSLPFSRERVSETDTGDLVDDLIALKEGEVEREAEKRRWAHTKQKAKQWDEYVHRVINPLGTLVASSAPSYRPSVVSLQPPARPFAVAVGLTDVHFGMTASPTDTGSEQWGMDECESAIDQIVEDLINAVAVYGRPDRWIVGAGSDWFHIDSYLGGTTKGTPQDHDATYSVIRHRGNMLAVKVVDTLRAIAPVVLHPMLGNHDQYTSEAMLEFLWGWFRSAPDVTVHWHAQQRSYERYFNNLICLTHGHGLKIRDLPGVIWQERRQDCGEAANMIALTGHMHHSQHAEFDGLEWWQMPAFIPPDKWSAKHGHITSRRRMGGYIIDREYGIRSILFSYSGQS